MAKTKRPEGQITYLNDPPSPEKFCRILAEVWCHQNGMVLESIKVTRKGEDKQ